MNEANEYLKNTYMKAYNAEFTVAAPVEGSAFVPWIGGAHRPNLALRIHRLAILGAKQARPLCRSRALGSRALGSTFRARLQAALSTVRLQHTIESSNLGGR